LSLLTIGRENGEHDRCSTYERLKRLVLLLAVMNVGCLGFGAIPPSKLDVGIGGAVADGTDGRLRIAYGPSLAAAFRSDLPVDVTAGVIGDVPLGKHPKAEAAHWAVGMFAEPAFRIARWRSDDLHMRLWLAPRFELFPGEHDGRALLVRTTFEFHWPIAAGGASSKRKSFAVGGIYGNGGVGLYLEAGVREMPQDLPGVLVTGGIMVRFPAAAGIFGFAK
jgi:hypothetical protein